MRTRLLTWDWKEDVDWDEFAAALTEVSGGTVHLVYVDTESDQFAIILTDAPMTDADALAIYEADRDKWS